MVPRHTLPIEEYHHQITAAKPIFPISCAVLPEKPRRLFILITIQTGEMLSPNIASPMKTLPA